jgi:hypothetical protein
MLGKDDSAVGHETILVEFTIRKLHIVDVGPKGQPGRCVIMSCCANRMVSDILCVSSLCVTMHAKIYTQHQLGTPGQM